MPHIVLTEEQARVLAEAQGPVEVHDPQGRAVASLQLFDAFDLPDMHNSCARRMKTTTAPQALLLLNGDFTLQRARSWAAGLSRTQGDEQDLVALAYRTAWGRPATSEEVKIGLDFLTTERKHASPEAAAIDFCHAILNSNEFLFVD